MACVASRFVEQVVEVEKVVLTLAAAAGEAAVNVPYAVVEQEGGLVASAWATGSQLAVELEEKVGEAGSSSDGSCTG